VIVAANTVSLIWSFLVDGVDQSSPDTPTLDRYRERLKPQLAPAQYTPGRNQQLRHFDWGETVGALEHPGATGRIAKWRSPESVEALLLLFTTRRNTM
jgi:hypothetical protein